MGDRQPIETSSSNGESSESLKRFKYHVFLSFRGPNVRKGFIDHLCRCLKAEGVRVFLDNHDITYGEEIMPFLYQAIEESQLHVITFSPQYGDSKWCLKELVKIRLCNTNFPGHTVLPVFYNIEPRDVRDGEEFMSREILDQADTETVSSYKTALGEIGNLKGISLEDVNGYEGQLVHNIAQEVISIVCPRQLLVKENIIGRASIVQDISTWLEVASNAVEVGMIYGAGGMGKSTISQLVYNKNLYNFTGACFVADYQREASDNKGLACILEQIISDVSKEPVKKIRNVPSGLKQLQDAVRCRKTLLILDDVDDLTKVADMFRDPDFFYPGSRIIITTRNQEMRKVFWSPVKEFSIEKLDDVQSANLFYLNAFHSDQPPQEYKDLSKNIIKYCDGLPLALCTLASSLYDMSTESWEYTLEELAKGPVDTVQTVLKLSFDSIKDKNAKELFLDIAHYFNGVGKDVAFTILDSFELYPKALFPELVARCLVNVDRHGRLMMHQLIREMALEVFRREAPNEPGHRSRLLKCEESLDVLVKKEGSEKVRCVRLDPVDETWAVSPSYLDQSGSLVEVRTNGFKKMENLKFLQISLFQLTGSYSNMPKKLKCLEWNFCELESIPSSFKLDELVVLDMKFSRLVRVWESTRDIMVLKALKIMDLSHSSDLTEISDLSGCPALERIILQRCTKLVKIHESITQLTKLTYINVLYCKSLKKIPCSTSISGDAYGCDELEEIGDNIKLETRKDMDSGWAEYIGYSDLESLKEHPYKKLISKVLYQSGIFSVFLYGNTRDHIAKWFATTREGPQLTYTVPSRLARRIRGFNICCVYDANYIEEQLQVQIQNQSSTRKWRFIPILHPKSHYAKERTWLTHWPITQHRRLNAGDTLEVTFISKWSTRFKSGSSSRIKCGIEVLYDDEFKEEHTYGAQCVNTLHKDRKGQAKFAVQYDTIFHNSDLSKHEIEAEPGVYQFRGSSINLRVPPRVRSYEILFKKYQLRKQLHAKNAKEGLAFKIWSLAKYQGSKLCVLCCSCY